MKFGDLDIPIGAGLAPMAGATDTAMRVICAEYKAAYTVSEMVSAKALCMGDKKSPRLLRGGGGQAFYGVQLFGYNAQDFAQAIEIIDKLNINYDFLDINMGCPAPKITKSGSGSALLKNPTLAGEIVAACVGVAKTPVTVKMRLGWDENSLTAVEVSKRCEAAGAAAIAVHARTRAEMYTPIVHYDEASKVKAAVKIPVIINGDVTSAASALYAMEQTGCDGVMIGRAALGNPWLFAQVCAAMSGKEPPSPPSLEQRFALMRRHVAAMCDEKGEQVAMNEARSHAAWYMQGLRGAAALRRECCALQRFSDVDALIARARQENR